MSRQILVSVVIIVVLGGLLGGYYYMTGGLQPTVPINEQPVTGTQTGSEVAEETKGVTGLEAATEIQSFVDSRRQADGYYGYSYNCEKGFQEDCQLDISYPTTNAWATLSNLGMYRATGDVSYLNNARRDADLLIDWCEGESHMCQWVLVQVSELYDETKDQRYADFLLKEGALLMDVDGSTDAETIFQRNSTMLLGIEARQLAQIYKINGDDSYITEANERISQAYDGTRPDNWIVYEFNDNKFTKNSCWVELANMELYEATGDENYMLQAKDLLDSFDPAGNSVYMIFMTNLQPCAELYMRVYQATGDSKYMDGAVKISNYILENLWDRKDRPIVSGSGTILYDTESKRIDTLTDTAYMVYILSMIKDSEVLKR